jgi:hypothetical protein
MPTKELAAQIVAEGNQTGRIERTSQHVRTDSRNYASVSIDDLSKPDAEKIGGCLQSRLFQISSSISIISQTRIVLLLKRGHYR